MEQDGWGGHQEREWGGAELGPPWQNFRYLRYATLTAVLHAPALPPAHSEDGVFTFRGHHIFCARLRAPAPSPCPCPTPPPGKVSETPGGADHFRRPFVTLISCLYPHLATPFGLFDRLSPRLEACFPA